MRLIGEFQSEKEAFGLQTFLQNHGIKSFYEPAENVYRLWVVEEDDFSTAYTFYEQWKQNPAAAQFQVPFENQPLHKEHHSPWKVRSDFSQVRAPFSVTHLIIAVCGFLFLWGLFQMAQMEQTQGVVALEYELVPIQKQLLFDYPAYLTYFEQFFEQYQIKTPDDLKHLSGEGAACFTKIKEAPTWKGVADILVTRNWTLYEKLPSGTLFGKIREGEFWRLITPVFLHGGWLHILFNMAWLYLLGRQVEERIGRFRYLFLSLLLGVMGNVFQYLVSGPIFLGYSGIITGLVGFIWTRQKIAPWEGYPLQRSVVVFIAVFVAAMLVLEIISMALQYFHVTEVYANIANTAHVIGGFFGVVLGRLSWFARR